MYRRAIALDGQTTIAGDAGGRLDILRLVEPDIKKPTTGDTRMHLLE
jgi:hypothetical protein